MLYGQNGNALCRRRADNAYRKKITHKLAGYFLLKVVEKYDFIEYLK